LPHPQVGFMEFPSFPFLLFWQFLWPRPVTREERLPAVLAQWGTKASAVQRASQWMPFITSWEHRGAELLQLQRPKFLQPASLKLCYWEQGQWYICRLLLFLWILSIWGQHLSGCHYINDSI
jgi:hypothetical protein